MNSSGGEGASCLNPSASSLPQFAECQDPRVKGDYGEAEVLIQVSIMIADKEAVWCRLSKGRASVP
jgi:hypothetical protein